MCKAFEELAEKRVLERALELQKDAARRMLADGKLSVEDIAGYLGLPINVVEDLVKLQTA